MIQELINKFMANKPKIRAEIAQRFITNYDDLVKLVIKYVGDYDWDVDAMDVEYMVKAGGMNVEYMVKAGGHDYQGALVYVVPDKFESCFWYVVIDYGSCSSCDTLQSIHNYDEGKPTEQQIDDYMTLCLHIAQGFRLVDMQSSTGNQYWEEQHTEGS